MNEQLDGDIYQGEIQFDSNNNVHLKAQKVAFTESGERETMLCGANLAKGGLPADGMRLCDEQERGNICDACLNALRERNATIPGFLRDGNLVNTRSAETGTHRGESDE